MPDAPDCPLDGTKFPDTVESEATGRWSLWIAHFGVRTFSTRPQQTGMDAGGPASCPPALPDLRQPHVTEVDLRALRLQADLAGDDLDVPRLVEDLVVDDQRHVARRRR